MFGKPAQIKLHLPFIGGLELAELEIDRDEAAQTAMIEKKIDIVILIVDRDALLPCNESKVRSEFHKKTLQLPQDCRLNVFLAVLVLQPQEVEQVWIAKDQVG